MIEIVALGLILLLMVALAIRSLLRFRCLGKCAGCPHAKNCGMARSCPCEREEEGASPTSPP